jgi:hypothetical protein
MVHVTSITSREWIAVMWRTQFEIGKAQLVTGSTSIFRHLTTLKLGELWAILIM